MKVDTLNVSNLVLIIVPTITNKNIKKICMENTMYLLLLMIENVNFFICTVNRKCQLFLYVLLIENVNFFYMHC
jgi:hypothetical protein